MFCVWNAKMRDYRVWKFDLEGTRKDFFGFGLYITGYLGHGTSFW
jgi:hypothetical protein